MAGFLDERWCMREEPFVASIIGIDYWWIPAFQYILTSANLAYFIIYCGGTKDCRRRGRPLRIGVVVAGYVRGVKYSCLTIFANRYRKGSTASGFI
jgi:hypothetical protein